MSERWKWALAGLALAPAAWSFCGFYVAQEPGSLFNKSSKVVMARKGDHTVLTMANDYRGDPSEFGLVVPVPQEITPERVRVTERRVIDKLDQFSVPRLAEYQDEDPCPAPVSQIGGGASGYGSAGGTHGVRIEQAYSVEEYDIVVISATDGDGLQTWLQREGYQVPEGAGPVLSSYIQQGMHFFLAKIDLEARQGWPRPLQVEYDSPKFMLPIRLGTLNAQGAQDLLVFTLTERGRVETTNYRTAKMPTDLDIPEYIADGDNFTAFYTAMFERTVARDGMSAVYLEYAWPLAQSCDPCSGSQLTPGEYASLGAVWEGRSRGYLTRLHVRYDAAHFPEDLVFQETADRERWQARYVVHRRYEGDTSCAEGRRYERELRERQNQEVSQLARLTGWDPARIWSFVPRGR